MSTGRQRAEFDGTADAIYVYLADKSVARTVMLDDVRNVDYADDGSVTGVEFLNVSTGIDLRDIPFGQQVQKLIGELGLGIRIFA